MTGMNDCISGSSAWTVLELTLGVFDWRFDSADHPAVIRTSRGAYLASIRTRAFRLALLKLNAIAGIMMVTWSVST